MTQQTYPRLIHPCSTPPLTLSTPGVPLALLATSHPTPTILLVSTSPSLPAVLATSSLSLLAPTASSTITDIAVIPRTSGPMIVGVTLSYNGEDGGRSVVYTLEVTIPEKGVGMNLLLGTQAITREYIKVEESSNHSLDEAISEFKKVATNSEKSNAKEILSRWLKAETDKAASLHSEQTVKRIIDAVFSLALKQEEGEVKPTGLYVDGIIRDLISRRCVTDEMYPGGVVSALTALSDWVSVRVRLWLTHTDDIDSGHSTHSYHSIFFTCPTRFSLSTYPIRPHAFSQITSCADPRWTVSSAGLPSGFGSVYIGGGRYRHVGGVCGLDGRACREEE